MSMKKLLAAALSVAMIVGSFASISSFAAMPSDVTSTNSHAEAIETLGALKIMVGDAETGLFRPTDKLKRSEFAKVAVTLVGLQEVAESYNYQTKFPDVVANHWANGYINVATNQGFVIGDDQGNFRPDDEITYADAMTILVRVLGYEPTVASQGGYPTGYIVQGASIGLSKNATMGYNQAVTREITAQAAFNALTIKMMEQTGYGSNLSYEVVDKTILKNKLKVDKLTGQVKGVGESKLSNVGAALKDDQALIGTEIYNIADAKEIRNMLGFNVVYYVTENDTTGEYNLLLARPQENMNSSITVTAANIEKVTGTDRKVFEYWENKDTDRNTKKVDIADTAAYMYNGKPLDTPTNEELMPEAGKVTLLDINRDELYDLVFVTSYENYVVEDTSLTSYKVNDKYGNPSLTLDPTDRDVSFSITKGSLSLKLEDLKEWDVLSVAKSLDGRLITIEVSNTVVEGKVLEVSGDPSDRENYKLKIAGTEYKMAANYPDTVRLEDEGRFYLDVEGKIASFQATSLISDKYSYLVAAGLSTSLETTAEFKFFGKDGTTVTLKGADKMRVNETSNLTPAQVLAKLTTDGTATGPVKPQLVTYDVNSEGKVTKLVLANETNVNTGAIDKNNFTLNIRAEGMVYNSTSNRLVGSGLNVKVDTNTIVFDIPAGKTLTTDFAVRDITMLQDKGAYDVVVYDVGENMVAKVLIVTNSSGSISAEASMAVVDYVTKTNNTDGERVDKLYAYQDGKTIDLMAAAEDVLVKESGETSVKLETGDVIQYSLDGKGQIDSVKVLYNATSKELLVTEEGDMELVLGTVTNKFAGSMNVTPVDGGTMINYATDGATVYSYDSTLSKNQIKVVTAGDITKYDPADPSYVLVRLYKDTVKEIVIIK